MSTEPARFAADDWGLSPAINAGILRLAEKGRLHSVSLMANAPYLHVRLSELLGLHGVQLSLHLNFTYGKPIAPAQDIPSLVDPATGCFYPHRSLILRGFSRRINAADVIREFAEQLRTLRAAGVDVSGVDGHHHIHLLPGVAGPLHNALLRYGLDRLRLMNDPKHRASYLQTFLFKNFIAPRNSPLRFDDCKYLLPEDLASAESFREKMVSAGHAPLLVHPALYNDFAISGMLDSLQDERVHELETILKYLND